MNANKDYYKILQLDPSASPELVEKAFRVLSMKYHPDRNPVSQKSWAEEKFKDLKEAYDTIIDPDKRKEYDQLRAKLTRKPRGPFFKVYYTSEADEAKTVKHKDAKLTLELAPDLDYAAIKDENEESYFKSFKSALDLDLFDKFYSFILNLFKIVPYLRGFKLMTKTDNRELLFVLNHCFSILKMNPLKVFLAKNLHESFRFYGVRNPIIVLNEKLLNRLSLIQKIHFLGYILGHIQYNHIYHLKLANILLRKKNFQTKVINLIIIGKLVNSDLQTITKKWLRSSQNSAHRIGLLCTDDLDSSQKTIIKCFETLHNIKNLTVENVLSYSTYDNKQTDKRLTELSVLCNDVKHFSNSSTFVHLSKERPRYIATCHYCDKTAKISYKNLMTKNIKRIRCPFCDEVSAIK